MKYALLIVALIALAFVLVRHRPKNPRIYPFKLATLSDDEQDFMNLWFLLRTAKELPTMRPDDLACEIAWDHNIKMMAEGKAFHSSPDKTFAELVSIGAYNMEEIVLSGFSTVESAFKGFVNSPRHYRSLISPNVNCCGISLEKNENDKYFVVVILFKA